MNCTCTRKSASLTTSPEYHFIRFYDIARELTFPWTRRLNRYMKSRYIAITVLALAIGGVARDYRVERAHRFKQYYCALHEEQPDLTAWKRVLVSLALTNSN